MRNIFCNQLMHALIRYEEFSFLIKHISKQYIILIINFPEYRPKIYYIFVNFKRQFSVHWLLTHQYLQHIIIFILKVYSEWYVQYSLIFFLLLRFENLFFNFHILNIRTKLFCFAFPVICDFIPWVKPMHHRKIIKLVS